MYREFTFIADFEIEVTSLEFERSSTKSSSDQTVNSVENILKELDSASSTFIESEVPVLFSQLVDSLRHLDAKEMKLIYDSNRFSRVWRFLVDAAPMVATPASMEVVAGLIALGQMTPAEADAWFTSMAFIPHPELEMFSLLPVSIF